MGIYIKNVKIPERCWDCHFFAEDFCPVMPYEELWTARDGKHPDCPLIEVPPHERLIDANALKVSLAFAEKSAKWAVPAIRAVLTVIDEMPTIIDAEYPAGVPL